MDDKEMDNFILNNANETDTVKIDFSRTPASKLFLKQQESDSRGNSPPKEDEETTQM